MQYSREDIIELTETIQQSVDQMKRDDIDEAGEFAFDEFQCECCGDSKIMAGSVVYESKRLCNECVLFAEVAFATGKIKRIQELIDKMEDKRLETLCQAAKELEEESANLTEEE